MLGPLLHCSPRAVPCGVLRTAATTTAGSTQHQQQQQQQQPQQTQPVQDKELQAAKAELDKARVLVRGLRRALLECEEHRDADARRYEEQRRLACKSLARDMLAVVDVLEQAAAHPSRAAVGAVQQDMLARLARHDVRPLPEHQQRTGAVFDPTIHNAVAVTAPTAVAAANTVARVHKRGFTLGGVLLRPADVTVAVASSSSSDGQAQQ